MAHEGQEQSLNEIVVLQEAAWRHQGVDIIHPGDPQLPCLYCGQRALEVKVWNVTPVVQHRLILFPNMMSCAEHALEVSFRSKEL